MQKVVFHSREFVTSLDNGDYSHVNAAAVHYIQGVVIQARFSLKIPENSQPHCIGS